jgi:hypothetical protein
MIEKLTISKLKASGFNESQIQSFKTNPQYEAYYYNKSVCFYASNKEKKIYSGSDATLLVFDKCQKNIPFPYWDKDFIPIYFETKKRLYIKEQKRVTGNNFIEKAANEKFKADEIQCIKNELNPFQLPERNVLFNIYLNWLYDLDSNLKPKPIRTYYTVKLGNIVNNFGSGEIGLWQYAKSFQGLNDLIFKNEIISTPPEKIPEKLEFHLRSFERNGGEKMDWISHTKDLLPVNITPQQKDSFLSWIENTEVINNNLPPEPPEPKQTDYIEKYLTDFKDVFNNEKDYEKVVECINSFFLSQKINIKEPFFVKNGNIRSLAFAMGEIWRSKKNQIITYEYLQLYKQLFTIFKKQKLDKKNVFSENLYKYSLSKT